MNISNNSSKIYLYRASISEQCPFTGAALAAGGSSAVLSDLIMRKINKTPGSIVIVCIIVHRVFCQYIHTGVYTYDGFWQRGGEASMWEREMLDLVNW